jgi:signal transduction histidine kinase
MSVLETSQQISFDGLSARKPEKLSDIITDAIEQTRHLLGGIRIDTDMEQMTGLRVACDKKMLVQVLVNLVRNGAEAILERKPENGGLIAITVDCGDSKAVLKIADNGIGMEPQVVDKIFRFKFTTKKDGTGIGLHLSKMILKLHDGNIAVTSHRGEGTIFSLYLPLDKQPAGVGAS